jgi:hypothetical protein
VPVQTYDFAVPGEYAAVGITLGAGDAQLVSTALSGTVLGNVFFKGISVDALSVVETPNGGTVLYGLEIDTVLSYHDGLAWVPSDGSPAQLNTFAQVQANIATILDLNRQLVKPLIYMSRLSVLDPSPVVDDLAFTYSTFIPNQQIIPGNDAAVAADTGVGGAASPGETRVTLDPNQVQFTPGQNDLFVFRNGAHQVLGVDYIEEDNTHIVFTFAVDGTGPFVDSLEFRSAAQGNSLFIPPPETLVQANPPERPDNFGGIFSFV